MCSNSTIEEREMNKEVVAGGDIHQFDIMEPQKGVTVLM